MKKTKKNKCKNCKGRGLVAMGTVETDIFGNAIKGLKECPICKGTGEKPIK